MTALSIPPAAIAVGGTPGSGKSTLGRGVARRLGAALLDQDTMTNPLLAQIAALVGAGDDLDHPALRGSVRDARYRCLAGCAAEILATGLPVVLIAPFTGELADAAAWQGFSAGLSLSLLVRVAVPAEVAARRRRERDLPRDRAAAAAAGSVRAGSVPAAPAATDPEVPAVAPIPPAMIQADGAADPEAEASRLAALVRTLLRG